MIVGSTAYMSHIVRHVHRYPPSHGFPDGHTMITWMCNNTVSAKRAHFNGNRTVGCQRCLDAWRSRVRGLRNRLFLTSWGDLDSMEAACEAILEFAVREGLSDQIERAWA